MNKLVMLLLLNCLFITDMHTLSSHSKCLLECIKKKLCNIDVELDNVAKESTSLNILATTNIIEEIVRDLRVCAPIPILSTGDTTINEPGVYCLVERVTGTITINTNNVVLDLNGKEIFGNVIVSQGISFVAIINGAIVNSPIVNTAIFLDGASGSLIQNVLISNMTLDAELNGIFARFVRNIVIQNSSITNAELGILFSDVNNAVIENTQLNDNDIAGLQISGSNITIRNCSANGTAQTGIAFNNASSIKVENCQALTAGTGFGTTSNCSCIAFEQCTSTLVNLSQGAGFLLDGSDIVCSACFACGNSLDDSAGFDILGSNICIERCTAKNYDFGFRAETSANNGVLKENIAVNNGTGFRDRADAASTVRYVANYASNNTTNYNPAGAPFTPVSPAAAGSFWKNITD